MASKRWKQFNKFGDTFQTADEYNEWRKRYSLKPAECPTFAVGSNAIGEIRGKCGIKQAALAHACGIAKSTFSGYEKSPEGVSGVMVRRIIDGGGAERPRNTQGSLRDCSTIAAHRPNGGQNRH